MKAWSGGYRIIKMRFIARLVSSLAVTLVAGAAGAQQIEMSSSLNPVGSGARATGMGGAFIGVADDATAASWNPAGLIQLEKPEVSFIYGYFKRTQDYSSDVHPEIAGENTMDANGVNYASAAYPLTLFKKNVILSLNYQRLYDMDKSVKFNYAWDMVEGTLDDAIEFTQEGFLSTISPAFAMQVTKRLSLGATLNFWTDLLGDNGWDNTYRSRGRGTMFGQPYQNSFDRETTVSFSGVNASLGALWSLYGPFTLGVIYKTPFDADLTRDSTYTISQSGGTEFTESLTEDLTMRMPASYGVGLSYRHSDRWTVALDVYRTDWSSFVVREADGTELNPLTSRPISEGRLDDTTQVRLGTEYLFVREKYVIPVRCGVFYDPEPRTGGVDDYYGIALGTGYSAGRFSIDGSYQYRIGDNARGDIPSVKGSSADVAQHTVMASLIYYFR